MASTFTADKADSDVQARSLPSGVIAVTGSYTITAALVQNDVIQMVKVPLGATILDTILSADDLDTHETPAIVLEVGDGVDPNRFIDASTIGQAGGMARMNVRTGVNYQYTAEDTIDVKVPTAPATGATEGTIKLTVLYTMDA